MKIKGLPYIVFGIILIFVGLTRLAPPEVVDFMTGAAIGFGAILVMWGFIR